MAKSDRMYDKTPKLERNEEGKVEVKKPEGKLATETSNGLPDEAHAAKEKEQKDMHKRHEDELKAMHKRHEKMGK